MSSATSNIEIILSELDEDGILRLTLNDPSRHNALSEAMLEKLKITLDIASRNASVRVIVLAANGPTYCAGHDLKEITAGRTAPDMGHEYFSYIMNMCSNAMQAIVTCKKPVIAEITGIATAAGCQLVASCDLAIADSSAKFSTPGVNIGLFCSTPMVALSRNVSNKHALEMLLTGEMISARRAMDFGLINSAVETEALRDNVMNLARKIASKSSATVAIGKAAFYTQREMNLSDAYKYTSEVMIQNLLTSDASEGISAFIEKRKPQWKDK
jgi:enoyl-CoA hydratase/carnithine racemase|tara:strand:+ start:2558 stop:3370 length:813 start_codon:yes stop_codon:yes gene_type:complete